MSSSRRKKNKKKHLSSNNNGSDSDKLVEESCTVKKLERKNEENKNKKKVEEIVIQVEDEDKNEEEILDDETKEGEGEEKVKIVVEDVDEDEEEVIDAEEEDRIKFMKGHKFLGKKCAECLNDIPEKKYVKCFERFYGRLLLIEICRNHNKFTDLKELLSNIYEIVAESYLIMRMEFFNFLGSENEKQLIFWAVNASPKDFIFDDESDDDKEGKEDDEFSKVTENEEEGKDVVVVEKRGEENLERRRKKSSITILNTNEINFFKQLSNYDEIRNLNAESDEYKEMQCKLVLIQTQMKRFDLRYDECLTNSIIKGVILIFMRIIRFKSAKLAKKNVYKKNKKKKLIIEFISFLENQDEDNESIQKVFTLHQENKIYRRWLRFVKDQLDDDDTWFSSEEAYNNDFTESFDETLILLNFESIVVLLLWIADFAEYYKIDKRKTNKNKTTSLVDEMPHFMNQDKSINDNYDFTKREVETKANERIEGLLELFFLI
jgi:hypothetical protein